MDVEFPKHHSFRECEKLRETRQYLRTWKISVPLEDSLEWSIVLSHLRSVNFTDENEFKNRLLKLCDNAENFLEVKKCVSSFNPFLNRYSCFYNKYLQKVICCFKRKLEEHSRLDNAELLPCKLEAASLLLKSYIIVVSNAEDASTAAAETFPESDSIIGNSNETRITLYRTSVNQSSCRFHFGIKKEHGNQLKKAAFSKIMKQASILKKRRNALFTLDKEGESFVTSILKSDYKSSILNIYKSSYTVWKLVEAGFEMDPRLVDSNGLSAFYYALDDKNLPYILHNYAVNACHPSDKTFRDPDQFILLNLKNLGEIITSDKEKSRDLNEVNKDINMITLNSDQLIRFNEFLIKMCENILQEQGDSDGENSLEAETIKRRNVMLAVLKTYTSFFFFDESEVSEIILSQLDYYSKYNRYYRNLDFSAALFFFDNIFYLKERIPMANDEYSELESSFFLSVLSSKYFSREILKSNIFLNKHFEYQKLFNNYITNIIRSPEKIKYFKIIPLLERLCLRENIKNFIQKLNEARICENVLTRIPEEEVPKTLAAFPEIKDELIISRLTHYLQTALRQNMESTKQSLVVERALQVLGECVVYGSSNMNSLCFLLFICLPEETFRLIKQTRNMLSHLNEYTFAPKLKAERNSSLFRDVQRDLEKIFELFQGILEIQQLRLTEFLFKRGLEQIKRNISSGRDIRSFSSTEQLSEILKQLEDECNTVCRIKSIPCYNSTIFRNRNVLINLFKIIDTKLNDEMFWTPEQIFGNVKNILWPLRYLLTLVAEDCEDSHIIQEVLSSSEEILSCSIEDLQGKVKEFWQTYKSPIFEFFSKIHSKNFEEETKIIGTNIERFKKILKGFIFLSEVEEEEILSNIPESAKASVNFKNEIEAALASGMSLTSEQISKFPTLFLSRTLIECLEYAHDTNVEEALKIIKRADDPIKDLNSLLDGTCQFMKKSAFQKLCERLQLSDDTIKKLSKRDIGRKRMASENDLVNILNRIRHLREILIEECPYIHELWSKAKHVKTQQYAKFKIAERYARNPEVQASVEMLLSDCMVLLGNKTDIENLWIKNSSLFSGINLRNVLGHGNPTLENIGKLLDPEDLPSVLVEEMLHLIEDEVVVQAIYDLSQNTSSDFDQFQNIMNDEDSNDNLEIRQQILQSSRWKRYTKLLPRKYNKNNSSAIAHSISVESEECEATSDIDVCDKCDI